MKDEYNSEFYAKISEFGNNFGAEEVNSFDGNAGAEEVNSFDGNADAHEFPTDGVKATVAKASDGNSSAKIANVLKSFLAVTVSVVAVATVAASAPADVVAEVPTISAFYSIEHVCTCNVDGYFHFTLDFVDENGYWSDFSASLKDIYGNTSYCTFTEDLCEEQSIDVSKEADLLGKTATFTVSFKVDSPEHVPESDLLRFDEETQEMIYTVEVSI